MMKTGLKLFYRGEFMKLVIIVFLTFTAFNSLANDSSQSTNPLLVSRLEIFELDPEKFPSPLEFAKIKINEQEGFAQLTLRFQDPCPEELNNSGSCRGLRPEDKVITLPLTSKEVGACGETIFLAQKDNRAVDGPIETLQVVDQRSLVCRKMILDNQMTQVTYFYGLEGRKTQTSSESYLWGTQLEK
jgi:hypothetical protein